MAHLFTLGQGKSKLHRKNDNRIMSFFLITVLIGGLVGYILAWGIGGEKFPRKREERRGREKKELEE